MIRGIDDGWAELTFPRDPLDEDPQYVLTIVDSEKFAEGVEKLFPEVDWDEPVSAAVAEAVGQSAAPGKRGKTKKKKKRYGAVGSARRQRWGLGAERRGLVGQGELFAACLL